METLAQKETRTVVGGGGERGRGRAGAGRGIRDGMTLSLIGKYLYPKITKINDL